MGEKTVLIVDDERDLVEVIEYNLHEEGYRTLTAYDGVTGLKLAFQHIPDLIVLDLMMPRKTGQEVTVELRAQAATRRIPIIMLTAKSEEADMIIGLTLGADDYVVKPVSIKVLLARIDAVLRRASQVPKAAEVLQYGKLQIDRARHRVAVDGMRLALTLTEFRLLDALTSAHGRVLRRDQLMDYAMGNETMVTDRTIDVHITALRKKLKQHRSVIETIRGVEYRFAADEDRAP